MRRMIFGVMLMCAASSAAIADAVEDGAEALVRGDYAAALRLLRPVADTGNTEAQYFVAVMYKSGKGVPRDDTEAVKWYRKAADQGFAPAQSNLGFLYAQGKGVPRDDAEAVKWYRKAADRGYADAQFNLGVAYTSGSGVPRDYVQAHKWLSLAAARETDVRNRADAETRRNGIAPKMTRAQIAEARRLAREWKPK